MGNLLKKIMTTPKEESALGTETNIKIGFVLAVLIAIGGGLGAAIWWASKISNQMETIIVQQSAMNVAQAGFRSDVEDLKSRMKIVEAGGSTPLRILTDKVALLERDLEMHRALDGQKGNKP